MTDTVREELGARTIVIPGAWNPKIFTPEWITKNLTGQRDVQISIGFGLPAFDLRLSFDEVNLILHQERLVISPIGPSDESFVRAQAISVKILTVLNHTPIIAIGVNFKFTGGCDVPDAELFELRDTAKISAMDYELKASAIKRTLKVPGKEIDLNITVEMIDGNKLAYDFNYHIAVSSPEAAITALNDLSVASLKDSTFAFMEQIYGKHID